MQAGSIVGPVDVVADSACYLFARLVIVSIDFFYFERFEEAFHGGVVVAVSLSTHALLDVAIAKSLSKPLAGVL